MSARSPHILLITAGGLRKDALSCYGATAVRTPNVDRLAARGVRFENAYAPSPVGLASRCAIVTGLLPHNNRAYSESRPCRLSPRLPNLYNQLRGAGYATTHIGACRYASAPPGRARPGLTENREDLRGFYASLGMDHLELQDGKSGTVRLGDDYSRELDQAGHLAAYRDACGDGSLAEVFTFPGPAEWHPDSWVGRKAVEHLARASPDRPSFTWVSFSGPEHPFDPPEECLGLVDTDRMGLGARRDGEFDDPERIQYRAFHGGSRGDLAEGCDAAPGGACCNYSDEYWRKLRHHYLANVALIDSWVGRILDQSQQVLGGNTVILFSTDHGEMLGNHRLWGHRRCGYEDVLNVPLLIRLPETRGAERTTGRVMLVDIFPTFLGLAGVEVRRTDGRDLRLSRTDGGREYVFSEAERFVTVADRRFTYVHSSDEGSAQCELYDLFEDPQELEDLSERPECGYVAARLRGKVLDLLLGDVLG